MAGRVTQKVNEYSPEVKEVVFHCIGDSANGSVPDTIMTTQVFQQVQGMFLDSVFSIPSATGPTDDTDLIINDKYDVDMLGGNGANLIDETAKNGTVPVLNGQNKRVPLTGKATTVISNNSVNSAIFDIVMNFVKAV